MTRFSRVEDLRVSIFMLLFCTNTLGRPQRGFYSSTVDPPYGVSSYYPEPYVCFMRTVSLEPEEVDLFHSIGGETIPRSLDLCQVPTSVSDNIRAGKGRVITSVVQTYFVRYPEGLCKRKGGMEPNLWSS